MNVAARMICSGSRYASRYISIGSILGFLVSGLILISLGLTQSYTLVLICVSFFSLGFRLLASNLLAYSAYGAAERSARNIGVARGSFFVGAPVAQLLLEPVSKVRGNGMAIVTLACASLPLMLWPLRRGRRMAEASV